MADHGDKERLRHLEEHVVGMMGYLQELLLDLPIPVVIPDVVDDDDKPVREAIFALDRARDLIEDEPIAERYKRAYENLILEWFTAYEMIVLRQMAGPAPWRLDAAQFAIARFTIVAAMIEDGEIDES
jgi:hypothetical protein